MTRTRNSLWKKFAELIKKHPAIKSVLAALGIILFIFIVHITIQAFDGDSIYYSITFGIIFGLLCGYLLQNKISQNIRFGTVGIFSGMGLDLFANSLSKDSPETITAIDSVGRFISNRYVSIVDGSPELEIVEKNVSLGLWVSILVIALVLICAKIFNPTPESEDVERIND